MGIIMNEKEKQAQIALGTYLQLRWEEYLKTLKEAENLTKIVKLLVRNSSCSDSVKTANKIQGKIDKIYDKGRLSFNSAIKEVYGINITIRWWNDFTECHLSNGIIFKK